MMTLNKLTPAATGLVLASLVALALPALADGPSTSVHEGIHSQGLGLTGKSVAIGQVELGRPGLPGFDNAANSNPTVSPSGVFLRNGAAIANTDTRTHAEQVAGVMIAKGVGAPTSVAPDALLYSSAYGTGEQNALLAMQHVALRNSGDVRAINMSFGRAGSPNGNSLLTRGLDWSSRFHNTLYVIAGNEGAGGVPIPTDSYNGLTVSFSRRSGGVFNQVDPGNNFTEAPTDGRRTVALVAPGRDINMPVLGGGNVSSSGTSFAAPHVTGTVALLQEYGDKQIVAAKPHWDTDARQHEVMKAVLMNSADKIKDDGTFVFNGKVVPKGSLLGMEKTITDTNGQNWTQSDAFTRMTIPLDDQMGTGQLNAARALTQFKPGEYDSFGTAAVPLIGWDYGTLLNSGDINKYVFDQALHGGSFISITLAWDRLVALNDANNTGMYDVGETFADNGLTDLDLYLMPKGATELSQALWMSISSIDSVEHIFYQIPTKGSYEFWVREAGPTSRLQRYGLAWWAVPEPGTIWLFLAASVGLLVVRVRVPRRDVWPSSRGICGR